MWRDFYNFNDKDQWPFYVLYISVFNLEICTNKMIILAKKYYTNIRVFTITACSLGNEANETQLAFRKTNIKMSGSRILL